MLCCLCEFQLPSSIVTHFHQVSLACAYRHPWGPEPILAFAAEWKGHALTAVRFGLCSVCRISTRHHKLVSGAAMPFIAKMNFKPRSERHSIQGRQSSRDHPPPAWRCWTCQHDVFVWSSDDWICEQCGSMDYYDAAASLKRKTDDGVWLIYA